MWRIFLLIAGAGTLGGLINALVGGGGFALPRLVTVAGSVTLVPGFLGNLAIGAAAAVISYGLYGPFASAPLIRLGGAAGDRPEPRSLTPAALVGAILVGYSGGRWITAEADKQFNYGAAAATAQAVETLTTAPRPPIGAAPVAAAGPPPNLRDLARSIQADAPFQAFEKAQLLRNEVDAAATGRP